ncbi:MAG: zinc-binding dehydrogenase, partial [Actinomycetota bacterium]
AWQPNPAGFQEVATLGPRNIVFRIPDSTPDEAVIAFGCAMPTALAGFRRLGPLRGSVLVQGCGPVGLASVVTAALAGARQIVVIGAPDSRLDVALRLGATQVIPLDGTTIESRRELIMRLTDNHGLDAVIEAAGHPSAFGEGFDLLAPNGRYLILGLYSGQAVLPVDLVRVNNRNLRIIGSLGALEEDYRRTVEIATEYGERLDFAGLVTHRFPLDRTEEAIRFAATGMPVKTVITPSVK